VHRVVRSPQRRCAFPLAWRGVGVAVGVTEEASSFLVRGFLRLPYPMEDIDVDAVDAFREGEELRARHHRSGRQGETTGRGRAGEGTGTRGAETSGLSPCSGCEGQHGRARVRRCCQRSASRMRSRGTPCIGCRLCSGRCSIPAAAECRSQEVARARASGALSETGQQRVCAASAHPRHQRVNTRQWGHGGAHHTFWPPLPPLMLVLLSPFRGMINYTRSTTLTI